MLWQTLEQDMIKNELLFKVSVKLTVSTLIDERAYLGGPVRIYETTPQNSPKMVYRFRQFTYIHT